VSICQGEFQEKFEPVEVTGRLATLTRDLGTTHEDGAVMNGAFIAVGLRGVVGAGLCKDGGQIECSERGIVR